MDEKEIRTQAVIDTLISQRDAGLNAVARLQGEIQVLKVKITSLEEEKGKNSEQ